MEVYFIQENASHGNIKIGSSKNPETRLKAMQTGNSHDLTIIKSIKAEKQAENAVHLKFKKFRVKGEWFRPDDELLNFIDTLVDYGIDPLVPSYVTIRLSLGVIEYLKIFAEKENYISVEDFVGDIVTEYILRMKNGSKKAKKPTRK